MLVASGYFVLVWTPFEPKFRPDRAEYY